MTLLEYLNTNDGFASSCGMSVTEIRPQYARATMTVTERHLNGVGSCQGGAIFTLADLAAAAAMNSCATVTVGLENTVTYHRPALLGDRLTAEAVLSFHDGRIPFCRVEITDQNGNLIATFSSLGYRKKERIEFSDLM